MTEILSIYHRYNSVTPVGVYATAPQNTYAWKPNIARFEELNEKYQSIAEQVDFLSPVLYNYEGADTEAWKRAAAYNITAAKKYKTGKPILPYMTVTIRLDGSGKDDSSGHGAVRTVTEAGCSRGYRRSMISELTVTSCGPAAATEQWTARSQSSITIVVGAKRSPNSPKHIAKSETTTCANRAVQKVK